MRLDGLEREWIGALQRRLELPEGGDDRRHGFAVVAIGRGLPVTFQTIVVGEAHDDIAVVGVTPARDHEWMRRVELDCLVRELHPTATAGAGRAVRAMRNSLCADAVDRKLMSASARSLPRS